MELKNQKRIAGKILKRSPKRVCFDSTRLEDIKKAITRIDIKSLINEGVIKKVNEKGISKFNARKNKTQKRKRLRSGQGSRKGTKTARAPRKQLWMARIRVQRAFLKRLKEKGHIDSKTHTSLYRKAGGGFFRSKRHLQLYVEENHLAKGK